MNAPILLVYFFEGSSLLGNIYNFFPCNFLFFCCIDLLGLGIQCGAVEFFERVFLGFCS